MAREDRENRERVSARKRVETHTSGFTSTALILPKDAKGDTIKLFALDKQGIRKIDILPYRVGKGNQFATEGTLYFERTYWVHRAIGPDENSYVCPLKTAKKPCPICEHRAKLAKQSDGDEDTIDALKPKERQLWNVIDLENKEAGVQVWDISFHLFGKRLQMEIKNSEEGEDCEYFADPVDGKMLRLGVEEKTFAGRDFYEVTTIAFKNRVEPYGKSILERVYCLDDLPLILDYDKLKAIYTQTEDAPAGKSEHQERAKPKDDDDWGDTPSPKSQSANTAEKKSETTGSAPASPSKLTCPACTGTGKSSKGNPCKPCQGTGYLQTDDDEPAPAPKQEKKEAPKADDGWGDESPTPVSKTNGAAKDKAKETAPAGKSADDWDNW